MVHYRDGPVLHNLALQFIDSVSRHSTPGSVLEAMGKVLKDVGIELFCVQELPTPKQNFAEVLLASKLPPDWLNLYLARGYVECDASQRHAKRVMHPYEWKDAPHDPESDPRVSEFLHRACEFGVGNGFVVPIPGCSGNIGSVWMGGPNCQVHSHYKPSLHLMALYAFAHVQSLIATVKQTVTLSDRERGILTWVAAGRSVVEIGEILNISDRTVEWHLKRSIEKLNAKTRTNAVAIAIRDELIAV
jgi:LuxR family transcriptional regulator, quorum-sensing system regulator BjaR1